MIDFNRAPYLGTEVEYMQQAIARCKAVWRRTVHKKMLTADEGAVSGQSMFF